MRLPLNVKRLGPFVSAFLAGCATTTGLFAYQFKYPRVVYSSTGIGDPRVPYSVNDTKDASPGYSGPIFDRQGPLPAIVAQVGLPDVEPIKIYPGFLVLYDRRTRIPRWTLELITPDKIHDNARSPVDRYAYTVFNVHSWMKNRLNLVFYIECIAFCSSLILFLLLFHVIVHQMYQCAPSTLQVFIANRNFIILTVQQVLYSR